MTGKPKKRPKVNITVHDISIPTFKDLSTLSRAGNQTLGGGRFTYLVDLNGNVHMSTTNHDVLASHLGIPERHIKHAGSIRLNGSKGAHSLTTGSFTKLKATPEELGKGIERGFNEELVKHGMKKVRFVRGNSVESSLVIQRARTDKLISDVLIRRRLTKKRNGPQTPKGKTSSRTGKKIPPK